MWLFAFFEKRIRRNSSDCCVIIVCDRKNAAKQIDKAKRSLVRARASCHAYRRLALCLNNNWPLFQTASHNTTEVATKYRGKMHRTCYLKPLSGMSWLVCEVRVQDGCFRYLLPPWRGFEGRRAGMARAGSPPLFRCLPMSQTPGKKYWIRYSSNDHWNVLPSCKKRHIEDCNGHTGSYFAINSEL